MEYQKSGIELIKMRRSTRTFDRQEIDPDKLKKMEAYLKEVNETIKINAHFEIATQKGSDGTTGHKLGTYGMIVGAHTFLVGIIDKNEKDTVTFGYFFEKIILFATDLDLQTCWLGGTFKREQFTQKVEMKDTETIAIVSPLGCRTERPRTFEAVMRTVVGANKRKPWEELFYHADGLRPLTQDEAGAYATALEMVRLAPSASNKQPWRIIKEKGQFHFAVSRTKGYWALNFDVQRNDIGIAKCHFELAAEELGLKGSFVVLKDVKGLGEFEYVCTWQCGDEACRF